MRVSLTTPSVPSNKISPLKKLALRRQVRFYKWIPQSNDPYTKKEQVTFCQKIPQTKEVWPLK